MRVTYMSSAIFNQNPSRAKREADEGPLVVTDHGTPRYVLMHYADFEAGMLRVRSLADALRDPQASIDRQFEPARLDVSDGRDVFL